MTHLNGPQSTSPSHRILRLKTALLAVSFTLAGILLLMLNAWLGGLDRGAWGWLRALPVSQVGGTLLSAGFIGTILDMPFRPAVAVSVRADFPTVLL